MKGMDETESERRLRSMILNQKQKQSGNDAIQGGKNAATKWKVDFHVVRFMFKIIYLNSVR